MRSPGTESNGGCESSSGTTDTNFQRIATMFSSRETEPMSPLKSKSNGSFAEAVFELTGRFAAVSACWLVRLYQLLISPLLGPHCRFKPSCSSYAHEAFRGFGLTRGLILAVCRVVRCHPWNEGGYDPVPRVVSDSSTPMNRGRLGQTPNRSSTANG